MKTNRLFGNKAVRLGLLIVLAGLFVLAWRSQHAFQSGFPREVGGWRLAVAVVLLAATTLLTRIAAPRQEHWSTPSAPVEWSLATVLLLLGVLYRILYFSTVPAGMNHDAAWNGMYAIHITQGAEYTPYVSAAWGRETLFPYSIATLLPFWGNTPELIQLMATVFGIAALLPFYLFVRALLGPTTALPALALLAVSGWHGVFSRVGWRVITTPPFEILSLYGLWRALQTGRIRYWVLVGVGCGISINTYNAARIVPVVVAVLGAVFLIGQWRAWRVWVRGVAVAFAAFLAVGGPMLWYAANNFEKWQSRAEHLAEYYDPWAQLGSRWLTAFGLFNYRGNGNDFFIEEPLLEPMAAVLFVFGFLVAMTRIRRGPYLFLVLGFLLSLLPGVASLPNGNRCVTAIPFVYSFAAVGLLTLAGVCKRLLPPTALATRIGVAVIGVALSIAAIETHQQFLGPDRRPLYGISPGATAAGQFMREFMGSHKVYVVSGSWPEYTLTYLSYHGRGYPLEPQYVLARSFAELEPQIERLGGKGLAFILEDDHAGRDALQRLQRLFVTHELRPIAAARDGEGPVAAALIVPAPAAAESAPWANVSRVLRVQSPVQGPSQAAGTLCFPPVGDDQGVTVRVQLMVPELGASSAVGGLELLASCSRGDERLLFVGFAEEGLVVLGRHEETIVPRRQLQAGIWHEVHAAARSDGAVTLWVDGRRLDGKALRVRTESGGPIGGVRIAARDARRPEGQFYMDNLTVLPGIVPPGDRLWYSRELPAGSFFEETFESADFGPINSAEGWRDVQGQLTVAGGPGEWHSGGSSQGQGENAFDASAGDGPGQFNEPMGVAVGPSGDLYVADRLNHRIQRFTSDGRYLSSWGSLGDRPGQFREPHDLAADDQFLYVADTWNQRVQVFDWDGNFIFQIKDAPPLSSPRGIYARDGRIYLADSGNGVGRVFDRSGNLLLTVGQKGGSEPGHLVEPVDVAADTEGRIYVVNSGNNRIEVFSSDGEVLRSLAIPGWSGAGLKESYLAVDAGGTVYMSDWASGRIRRFRADGTELEPVGPRSSQPCGVAITDSRLIVAARAEHRLKGTTLEP